MGVATVEERAPSPAAAAMDQEGRGARNAEELDGARRRAEFISDLVGRLLEEFYRAQPCSHPRLTRIAAAHQLQ